MLQAFGPTLSATLTPGNECMAEKQFLVPLFVGRREVRGFGFLLRKATIRTVKQCEESNPDCIMKILFSILSSLYSEG